MAAAAAAHQPLMNDDAVAEGGKRGGCCPSWRDTKHFLWHECVSCLPYVGDTDEDGQDEELDSDLQKQLYNITSEDIDEIVTSNPKKRAKLLRKLGGVRGIADMLSSNVENPMGLNDHDFGDRIRAFGTNVYPRPDPENFFNLFVGALGDSTLIILIFAAVISLVLGVLFPQPGEESTGWIEGGAILFAVFLVSIVTAANDWNKERQFRSLSTESDKVGYDVWRGGQIVHIQVAEILVGDIVVLSQGDRVPADGLFVDGRGGTECHVDESVMTGETVAVIVSPESPVMLSGTLLQEGLAHMLVIATGSRSQWGQLLANLTDEKPPTPLQEFLDDLAGWIGYGGLGVASVVFLVLFVWWLIFIIFGSSVVTSCGFVQLPGLGTAAGSQLCFEETVANEFSLDQLSAIVKMFIIAVTIVVVAVPEGLPLAVTLSLAYSMSAMMKDNNLVRHLDACETMGGATNICSDKTGTLTENRMTVVQGWAAGVPFTSVDELQLAPSMLRLLANGIAINSKARFEQPSEYDRAMGSLPTFLGNKTECALLVFADRLTVRITAAQYDYERIRGSSPPVLLLNFNSDRKRMSTIVASDDPDAPPFVMHTKGASEIVLARSVAYIDGSGQIAPLGDAARHELEHRIETLAAAGLRTIGIAFRYFSAEEEWLSEGQNRSDGTPEHELVLAAIVGIEDPVRAAVPDAVRQCQRAGIFVRMVTGDNVVTASKIARDCGILTDGIAMEGEEFRRLDENKLDEVLPRLQVLARSQPLDKKILVEALMRRREVVAVTGDGTNDAPALRRAHVGLSMGIAGTMVAKEASDIIILDDNFASIVKAVLWGRCVYDNIRKFLQFQLTVNFSALVVAFIGAVTNRGTPLSAIQLLWVNLIMDTMAALALGTEKPTPDLLDRKPYGLKDRFISNIMIRNVIGQGLYQIFVLCSLLYLGPMVFGWEDGSRLHYTMIFNTFVWMQVFNEINSRKVNKELNVFEGIHRNFIFLGVVVFTALFQVLLIEFGGVAVNTERLGPIDWALCLGLGFVSLPLGFVLRLIPVPAERTGINESADDEDEADDAVGHATYVESEGSSVDDEEDGGRASMDVSDAEEFK